MNEELQQEFISFLTEALEATDERDLENKIKKLKKEDLEKYYQAFTEYKQKKDKLKKIKAAHGAKLNYINSLKNKCKEGEELVYFKSGGTLGCKCVKKAEEGIEFPNPIKKLKLKYLNNKDQIAGRESAKDSKSKDSISEVTYDPKTKKIRPATKDEIEKRRKNNADAYKGEGEGNYIQGPINKKKCGSKIKKHQLGGSLNSIPFYLAGTSKGGIKRFSLVRTGHKPIHFDSKKAAEDYRKKHKIVGRILDRKEEEFKPKVLRADNTRSGSTAYGRQNEEAQYNNLSFKLAYNKARQQGKEAFGYKGKVYSTDLKNPQNRNMTKMKKLYGNYLGFLNDPKLQNKTSREGRERQNRTLNVDNSYAKKAEAKESERLRKQNNAEKIAENFTADKFVDVVMPTNVLGNMFGKGVSLITGNEYTPTIIGSGFNPLGYARDMIDGNVGNLAMRGVDAYLTLGAPGASQFISKGINKAGTYFAPTMKPLSELSKYVPMTSTDVVVDLSGNVIGKTLNNWTKNMLTKGRSPFTKTLEGTKTYGRRSIEKAALKGDLDQLAINNGMNNASKYANRAIQNTNTGTTYFYRDPYIKGNVYDRGVDMLVSGSENLGNVAPIINVPLQYTLNEE